MGGRARLHRGRAQLAARARPDRDRRARRRAPPPGVEIVTWAERPELAAGLYEVAREATPDIPGAEEDDIGTLEEWLARDMQGASDDPSAVVRRARRTARCVGYAKLSLLEERTDRACHDLTGVKRAWRGRGIAAALKRTQIAWAKEHGYERCRRRTRCGTSRSAA